MKIGVPKEIKNHEYRVGLTPAGVQELVNAGHSIMVEHNAGESIGFFDQQFIASGAKIVPSAEAVFSEAELIIKVKEPQPDECRQLSSEQTLFTFLHLAADPLLATLLLDSGATCIAYETVTDINGRLPLLTPMSEVAGRVAVQAGAHHLEKAQGGLGCLLGGVPGVPPAEVLILGGGVVGSQAAKVAIGMGANVTLLDRSIPRLRELDSEFRGRLNCIYSSSASIREYALRADLVIGAVLVPGAASPKLLTREVVTEMKKGSVVVDVAIDQGGCFETSRATTHEKPTYLVDGVIHYCVANIPAAVSRTSTLALTNATLPYIMKLADVGVTQALLEDSNLLKGVNIFDGNVTCQAVAEVLNYTFVEPYGLIKAKQPE